MTRLFLVRHGETEWNQNGRFHGHSDIALSDKGREQAELLRDRLASQKLAAIYSSDLMRAYETAVILAAPHGLSVEARRELREVSFGEIEGLTFKQVQERYAEVQRAWFRSTEAAPPGGESLIDLSRRVWPFLKELKVGPEDKVLIVAHRVVLSTIISFYLETKLEHWGRMRMDNGSLSILDRFGERSILTVLNDTNHLGGPL
ncbi:MAG: histidine phosphatase family protein [Chloroflexi bacterium]|nr:histidine phosphatase family protein [Chloroflexota bacterium]